MNEEMVHPSSYQTTVDKLFKQGLSGFESYF